MIILGGRAGRLWPALAQRVTEAYGGRGERCILLVPEQYTLQTERSLMADLGLRGFFDIEVLSPSRLDTRIVSLAGADGRKRLDARGKAVAAARALIKSDKELTYFSSAARKRGFIAGAGEMIADFKRLRLTPEKLRERAETLPASPLRLKLLDLCAIYETYEEQLAGEFMDGEDAHASTLSRLPESGLAKGARIYAYGFDVITEEFAHTLAAFDREAAQVIVFLVTDRESAPDGDAFEQVRESAERARATIRAEGGQCEIEYLPPSALSAPPEMIHLERYLFALKSAPYPDVPASLRLFAAPVPAAEARFIAQQATLERERGVAISDMAVVCGDLGRMDGPLTAALSAYRIPAYIFRKRAASYFGAARFLTCALRAVTDNYRLDDMRELLKTGYAPLPDEEAFFLENYALAYGVRGNRWLSPFRKGGEAEKTRAESARLLLLPPLEKMRAGVREAKTSEDSLRALFAFLEDTRAYDTLLEQEQELLSRGMADEAARERQVWDAMLGLFDQMRDLLRDDRLPAKYAADWLTAGLSEYELSALPQEAESLLCTELGGTLPLKPKVIFLCGLTADALESGESGLLNDAEKAQAQSELKMNLGLDAGGRAALKKLDLWKTACAPTERLYISYSQAAQDGAALRPAYEIAKIKSLFPALVEEGGATAGTEAQFPLAPAAALDALGVRLRAGESGEDWLETLRWLLDSPEWKPRAQMLLSALYGKRGEDKLPGDISRRLFHDTLLSVSRLEEYAACPCRHFVMMGLAPAQRREWTISRADAGIFYHAAMERFTRFLPEIPGWPQISREACDRAADAALSPLIEQARSGPLGDGARMSKMLAQYARVLRRMAWIFTRGARESAFRPLIAEVRFGYEDGLPPVPITLPDGQTVYLRGKIDRIDRYAGDEGVYLRVIDYKSGAERLSPTRAWWGLQLQLLLYLDAAQSAQAGALPAGAFYQQLNDPLVEDTLKDIEDEIARKLRLSGVALKDVEILKKMDGGDPPLTLSPSLSKDGAFRKDAALCTVDELRALVLHARKLAGDMALAMRGGNIAPSPARAQGEPLPCDQCDCRGFCRRDPAVEQKDRQLRRMSFTEYIEKAVSENAGE